MPQAGSRRTSPGCVDPIGHERRHGPGRVVLAGVARTLEVVEDLLVDVAEMLPLGQVVEIDIVDLVDDLPHQLTRLHVVVCVLEHVAYDTAAVTLFARDREILELWEELGVNKREEFFARDAFGISCPGTPPKFPRDR